MWPKRAKSYSRSESLEAAGKAASRGKVKKAIGEYKKVLEADPGDHVVHGKLAPLHARAKKFREAWASFRAAGEGYLQKGFSAKAQSVYTQATRCIPEEVEAWEVLAGLQQERGLQADAVRTLLNGSFHFRRRQSRHKAVRLLRKAFGAAPWHFEVTLNLARITAKTGGKAEAIRLLNGLAEREKGRNLRTVRGAILRLSPTPASAWRWLRAAISGA